MLKRMEAGMLYHEYWDGMLKRKEAGMLKREGADLLKERGLVF